MVDAYSLFLLENKFRFVDRKKIQIIGTDQIFYVSWHYVI